MTLNKVSLLGQSTTDPTEKKIVSRINLSTVFAMCAVAFVVFGFMLTLTAGAPLQQKSVSSITNGTCSLTPYYSPVVLQTYVSWGIAPSVQNDLEKQASRLDQAMVRASFLRKAKLQDEKYESLYEASREYLKIADQKGCHPKDQAVAIHKARDLLKKASELPYLPKGNLKEKMLQLLLSEASLCKEVAKSQWSFEEKLSWIFRGIEELNLPKDPLVHFPCPYQEDKEKCEVVASLWRDAGDIFTQSSGFVDSSLLLNRYASLILGTNEEAAAVSYTHSGYFFEHSNFDDFERPVTFYRKAFQIYKNISTSKYSLTQAVKLKEKLVDTGFKLRHLDDEFNEKELFPELLKIAKFYEALAKAPERWSPTHSLIMQASHLSTAAAFAPSIEETVNLYKSARTILEKEWETNKEDCISNREFTHPGLHPLQLTYRWDFEQSLLGKIIRYEKEIKDNGRAKNFS